MGITGKLCFIVSLLFLINCTKSNQQVTLYDFTAKAQNGEEVKLDKYKGKVVLIVNTASRCGFTPQYEDLERLYETYSARGFDIMDFPCNQFGNQSPESDEETTEFCQTNYGTKFPQFSKIEVNGENETPLYKWLKSEKGFDGFDLSTDMGRILDAILSQQDSSYASNSDIKWNFTKFLIDSEGNVSARFEPMADMSSVEDAIVTLLR